MKKIKELFKNKKIVASAVIVLMLVGSTVAVLATSTTKPKYEVIKKEFTFEYGETVDIKATDIIKYDSKKNQPKVDINIKKDTSGYSPVGKYNGSVKIDESSVAFNVTVKDTTKPVFTEKVESINLDRESQEDITTKFKATDLSGDVKITTSDFDRNVAGTYEVTITAQDANKNKNTTKANVIVDAKTTAEKQAEAQAIAEQEQQNQNNGSSSSNISSSANNNTNGNNTNSGGSSNNGGTTPVTPTPPPTTCTFTSWKQLGNSGYANHDFDVTNSWAESNWPIEFSGYTTIPVSDNCGKQGWTIQWYKGT